MSRQILLISLFAFMTATTAAQNTNSSTTARPRSTGTNTNRSADPPKPSIIQQPSTTPPTPRTSPVKPKVVTPQAQAPGADTVLAAFERLLDGIRKADVKLVTGVYWNSPSLILFNNNGTVTKGWEQMRKNRESSYPDLKDVKTN